MTRIQHLYFDTLGQILILGILFYTLIVGYQPTATEFDFPRMVRAPTTLEFVGAVLRGMSLVLVLWQAINALVSRFIYQQQGRKKWLRYLGIYMLVIGVGILIFWLIILMFFSVALSGAGAAGSGFIWVLAFIFEFVNPVSGYLSTIFFTIWGVWYMWITARDLNTVWNKTI